MYYGVSRLIGISLHPIDQTRQERSASHLLEPLSCCSLDFERFPFGWDLVD